MSAESVVKAMIAKRLQDGKTLPVAYEDVIATLEAGVKEMANDADALRKRLESAGEPKEYIERRLSPYAIQHDLQMLLLHTARQLQQQGWQP